MKSYLDKVTANDAIKPLENELKGEKSKYDKSLSPEERVSLLNESFENVEIIKDLIEYVSSSYYRLKHGQKKKKHLLSHEDYFCNKLSDFATYAVENVKDEYSVLPPNSLEKGNPDRQNKRVIGFNEDVIDDFLANGVSISVAKGLELHVDIIESMSKRSDPMYRISEDEKRERRNQAVLDDLDKYPFLKENYEVWKKLGEDFGFDESYIADDKEHIKAYKLLEFEKDKNSPYTPEQRYYKLYEMYNHLGYELTKIREQLAKPVEARNYNQIESKLNTDSLIDAHFDLSNINHVKALLSIKAVKNKRQRLEYYPLYYLLVNENQNKIDSAVTHIINGFKNALNHTELNTMQRDIIELIMNEHASTSVIIDAQTNPYSLITEYINAKYSLNKTKAQILGLVEGKISELIANTYKALSDGVPFIECSGCHQEKLAITDNFSLDLRNKTTGLKSKCKKCYAEEQRVRYMG